MHLRGHAVSANALHSRLQHGWTQARVERAVYSIGNLMRIGLQLKQPAFEGFSHKSHCALIPFLVRRREYICPVTADSQQCRLRVHFLDIMV